MRVGVLALQGSVRDHARLLRSVGADPVPVRDEAGLTAVDALVIPGGESTTMWRVAERMGLLDPVAAAIAGGLPTFGTCAGMVMVANTVLDGASGQRTFGGIDMTVRRNAFGRQVDSFEAQVEVEGMPGESFPGVFIRAPWVAEAGPGVEVLARLGDRIVAVRQGPHVATSFHPELTDDPRMHELFIAIAGRRRLANTA